MLIIAAYTLFTRLNEVSATPRDENTALALAEAKRALISYATTYGEHRPVNADPVGNTVENDVTLPPGTLPCPEVSLGVGREGSESGTCGARDVAAIGRLPWRTLGLPPLRDGAGECLWYAVSGSFKANPSPSTLNWDSVGQFEVRGADGNVLAGSTARNRAVAVIFAPGPTLAGQDRSRVAGVNQCGGNYDPANYLDSLTVGGTTYNNAVIAAGANAVSSFVAGNRGDGFNDRLLFITADEIFAAVERRNDFARSLYDPSDSNGQGPTPALAQKVAAMIARYGLNNSNLADRRLPWAAPLNVTDFQNDSFDDAVNQYAGRPPYRVGTSRTTTSSTLVPSGCSSSVDICRLLIIDHAMPGWWRVAGRPLTVSGASRMDSPEGWWDKWKDQVFYIVSPEFAPASTNDWATTPNPCTAASKCVSVNGQRFAAVVVFAGKRQGVQVRETLADRKSASNYLDNPNEGAFSAPTMSSLSRSLSTAGNDQFVCIRASNLAIDSTCTLP